MQRGKQFHAALLAGTLALAAGLSRPAFAAVPGAPDGWDAVDIKSTGGDTSVTGSGADAVWTLTGNGADIQGTADQFRFAYISLPGDGGITARLLSQTGGDPGGWMKSGVMLRESIEPGSMMAAIHYGGVGKNHGSGNVETLDRLATNKAVVGGAAPAADLTKGPIWLRAQRQGQTYQLLQSADGQRWRVVDSRTVPIDASKPVLAGLSATAHGKPSLVATFDNVSTSAEIIPAWPEGPTRVQVFPGNGRVLLTFNTVPNATGYNVYRQAVASPTAAPPASAPELVNAKPTANTWLIDDGGGSGLANGTSYIYTVRAVFKDANKQSQETFDSPKVEVMPQVPSAGGVAVYYFGAPLPAAINIADNVLTIEASGSDIWDVADAGVFLATPVAGDYTITTKVLEKPKAVAPSTSNNVKAGPMIREGVGPSERYAYLFATSGRGILWERRVDFRNGGPGTATNVGEGGKGAFAPAKVTYPAWLRLAKAGAVVTATVSYDGTTFSQVDKTQDYNIMSPVTYAGIAMSSGDAGAYGTAKFDASGAGAIQITPAPAP